MVCATKTRNELVSDDDMNVPSNWREQPYPSNATVGHQEEGRTIAIHSLAVEPKFQRRGLGKTLLKAYIQRMQNSGVADRISILTYERLVPFYESVGFENRGASKVQYGGGGWVDMVLFYPHPGLRRGADRCRSWRFRRTPTAQRRAATRRRGSRLRILCAGSPTPSEGASCRSRRYIGATESYWRGSYTSTMELGVGRRGLGASLDLDSAYQDDEEQEEHE